jgi:hypothetical protein
VYIETAQVRSNKRANLGDVACMLLWEFEPVIWLEDHAWLKTMTKIFYSCSTEIGALPNIHTYPEERIDIF